MAFPDPSDVYVGYKDGDTGDGSDSDNEDDNNSEHGFKFSRNLGYVLVSMVQHVQVAIDANERSCN